MRRWNLILRVFLAEYLSLKPSKLKSRSLEDREEALHVAKSVTELVSSSSLTGSSLVDEGSNTLVGRIVIIISSSISEEGLE